MIDIVFLLLIFFLCVTQFRVPEGDLSSYLPRDRGTGTQADAEVIYPCRVQLAKVDGRVLCRADDRNLPQGRAEWLEQMTGVPGPDMNALERHLEERRETSTMPLRVVIDASPEVPAKYIVGVINRCTKLDIRDVSLVEQEVSID